MKTLTDTEIAAAAHKKVGNIIAYWRRKATKADIAAVRKMVKAAIDGCGLDATAEVTVDETDGNYPDMGHHPIKAVIKIHGAYPAVRMDNGTLVKGMDTITAIFDREAGCYSVEKHRELESMRAEKSEGRSDKAILKIGDSIPWEGESVSFNARTNGKSREYRRRHWDIFEGGYAGYGIGHIGGHYGYSDTWEHLAVDFAAYVRKVATDLGYAGKAWRKEVA